jgi:hypothetical protein
MKKLILAALVVVLPFFYYACDGGNGEGLSGTVPLYLTDDLGDYKQVLATLNGVELVHIGTGTSCTLLTGPEGVDIANLDGVLQFLDTSECPVRPYNRVRITFDQAVDLVDLNDAPAECLFVSYKDNDNPSQPNALTCVDGECSVAITGGINVIAGTVNPFALDFDLKNFEVADYGLPGCRVTLSVEPQNRNDIDNKMAAGYLKSVTGTVTGLDTAADRFTLTTRRGAVFTVDYSTALYRGSPQPDLDGLLRFASDHGLRTRVMAAAIDIFGEAPLVAATVYVKSEGRVSGLDSLNYLFTLDNAGKGLSIDVNYADAFGFGKVEGLLADDAWVETKLFGHDLGRYLAHEVEVEAEAGVDTDD